MNGLWLPRALVARAAPVLTRSGRLGLSRGLTTTPNAKKLPLAGVRVLDMSRVLAGVCEHSDCQWNGFGMAN